MTELENLGKVLDILVSGDKVEDVYEPSDSLVVLEVFSKKENKVNYIEICDFSNKFYEYITRHIEKWCEDSKISVDKMTNIINESTKKKIIELDVHFEKIENYDREDARKYISEEISKAIAKGIKKNMKNGGHDFSNDIEAKIIRVSISDVSQIPDALKAIKDSLDGENGGDDINVENLDEALKDLENDIKTHLKGLPTELGEMLSHLMMGEKNEVKDKPKIEDDGTPMNFDVIRKAILKRNNNNSYYL